MDTTNQDNKTFKCECCEYETTEAPSYYKHMLSKKHKINTGELTVKLKTEKIFRCECCEYETFDSSNYSKHVDSRTHKVKAGIIPAPNPEAKIFKCECCDEIFYVKSVFETHKKSRKHKENETGVKKGPIEHCFQCAFCTFQTGIRNSFVIHMHHCDEKPKKPSMIYIGLQAIESQLEKLKDKDMPRYVSGKAIIKDPVIIAEKIKYFEDKMESEKKRYNEALKNPNPVNVDDLIKRELERNKCYKYLRDEEFDKMVEKAYREMEDSE